MILLKLFWDFFRVSCFTFGGAYGAIPLIREMVLGNGWITDQQLTSMIAISESTPGPIMVNMATYIGYDQAGFWGSVVATLGVVAPAYLVILLILTIMKTVIKNPYVQAVLQGLKPCVIGIVSATGVYLVIRNITVSGALDLRGTFISGILGAVIILFPRFAGKKLSPILLICLSAILGVVVYAF